MPSRLAYITEEELSRGKQTNKQRKRADEMIQWIEAFAINPNDMSSVPRIHVVEGKKPPTPSCLLTSTGMLPHPTEPYTK